MFKLRCCSLATPNLLSSLAFVTSATIAELCSHNSIEFAPVLVLLTVPVYVAYIHAGSEMALSPVSSVFESIAHWGVVEAYFQ